MKSHSRIAVIRQSSIVFLALLLVPTSLLFAQTNRGGISGTVFDQQGAVVPGATVTIINVGTNQRFVAATSASGSKTVPLMPRSEEHTSELQSRGHLVCRL